MNIRIYVVLFAGIVALSLIAAPLTMMDWGEQAIFETSQIDSSEIQEDMPVLSFDGLTSSAQKAVGAAITSPDGSHTVFGSDDWPEAFSYTDAASAGQGLYVIDYEDQYYRLYTYEHGAFPVVYWLYELPFIGYGLGLGLIAYRVYQDELGAVVAGIVAVPGIAFHLIGPEFEFPVLAPLQYSGLGLLAVLILIGGLLWQEEGYPFEQITS